MSDICYKCGQPANYHVGVKDDTPTGYHLVWTCAEHQDIQELERGCRNASYIK